MHPSDPVAVLTLDGWRAPVLSLSEAGLVLPADTALARLLRGQPRGSTHAAELELAGERHPVRVRCSRGEGAIVELAFSALPPALRARLRASSAPPREMPAAPGTPRASETDTLAPVAGPAPPRLPGGRRLALASSAGVWRQTRRRRAEMRSVPLPPPPTPLAPAPVSPLACPSVRAERRARRRRADAIRFVTGVLLLALSVLAVALLLL